MPWVAHRAPDGWKTSHSTISGADDTGYEPLSDSEEEVDIDARQRAWACLLANVYEVDPMTGPKCGADMKVMAIIEDADEIKRILRHPVRIGRSPRRYDPDRLN
jgi:hypothetical protein